MIIYKCTNTITNECYIGQTRNTLHDRKVDHIYEAFKRLRIDKFHTALRDFGLACFVWEEIGRARNFFTLAKMEKRFILQFDSIENGYNMMLRNDKTMKRIRNAKQNLSKVREA